MRGFLPHYDFILPNDVDHALQLLATDNHFPIAGGTDLMVLLEAGVLVPGTYVCLQQLKEFKNISHDKDWLSIGALTTYSQISEYKILQNEFPNLVAAARQTGAMAIQNRGTLGGNIANASPAADSPPVLLCYDAELSLLSKDGSRRVKYRDFHLDYKKTLLQKKELISHIFLPRKFKGYRHYYRKVGTRKMQAISKVVFSGVWHKKGAIALALGSVAPIPKRVVETERFLLQNWNTRGCIQQAERILATEISPIDDIRSTSQYRLQVSKNLLRDFLWNGIGLKH